MRAIWLKENCKTTVASFLASTELPDTVHAHPLRRPGRLHGMAGAVERLQRVLRSFRRNVAFGGRHADDMDPLFRCLRTRTCAGRGALGQAARLGALSVPP